MSLLDWTGIRAELLANYVGLIARAVVKKAAAQGGGVKQFYIPLADSLTNQSDRQRFLRDVAIES